jgi:glycosyltransferase involved in cell wall biosynthesis
LPILFKLAKGITLKKINLLHIITGLPIGGAEKVLLDLCRKLNRDKFIVHVIGLNDENDFSDEFKEAGIEVSVLNMKKNPISFFKTFKTIDRYINDHDISIIHAHMFHPLVFANLLKFKKRDLKIVFTSHNENIGSKLREQYTKATKSLRDIDILFSKDMHTNIYKSDAIVIPNGVDIEVFQKNLPKNKKFTFLSIGVLRYQKNQVFIPECAKKLKDKGLDFQIQIVGSGDASGDFKKDIEDKIKEYNVYNEVIMLGSRKDIPTLISQAHALILPSHFEGMPIVILEAGAATLPIISTPVGSIPSLIEDTTGYLTPLENFADNMIEVFINYDESIKRAKKFFLKIDSEFSIAKMANSHQDIYEKIVNF